ncbi:MAG TPA: hypothetical protein VHV28_13895 [Solirubrobacteraceae bacterium]|nr:hypothetical protein [Solirubrobacteraceae bacterium]
MSGTLRIPVDGLPDGFAGQDPQPKITRESASKRAIVVVPDKADLSSGNIEVLLHFHGRNIGYRERTAGRTVRDVVVDQIEQQLAASGRNMVAVLPQGRVEGDSKMTKFGIGVPSTYVNSVLALALSHLPAARQPPSGKLEAGRLVVSGHSGGGPYAVAYGNYAQNWPSSSVDDWVDAPPVLLFDGINGPGELATLESDLDIWLREDLKWLSQSTDQLGLLSRRGLKFRSTWGTGSDPVYQRMNEALDRWLTTWFTKNATVPTAVTTAWRNQYRIEKFVGQHDYNVGTGHPASPSERTAVPPGLTQVPGSAAPPAYGGGGNLDSALGALRPNPIPTQVLAPMRAPRRQGDHSRRAADVTQLQRAIGNRAVGRMLSRTVTSKRLETETPLRATEASGMLQTMIVNGKFAVYVPWGWIVKNNFKKQADITETKVHVFFGAGGVTGDDFNDVLLHGLRSAANPTDWITIAVPGTTVGRNSIPTPFSDSDITDCLSAVGLTSPVTSLRLTGHSRGMVSLVAYAPKTHLKGVLDRVHVLDEFQVGDPEEGTYHGKIEVLIAAGIPRGKIVGYESQDPAKVHLRGISYIAFNSELMAVFGTVRLIQDSIARDPRIDAAAAATPTKRDPANRRNFLTVKDEVSSIHLPARGSLPSTAAKGTASLKSWMADRVNRRALQSVSQRALIDFVSRENLTRYPGQDWGRFAAHEFFVYEIAPELYR